MRAPHQTMRIPGLHARLPFATLACAGLSLAIAACAPAGDEHAEEAEHAEGSGDEHPTAPSVFAQIETDLATVEEKLVGLAEAMNEEQYGWRPMDGVRSTGEMFMHVTADNYFLPAMAGVPVPEHTKIADPSDANAYQTVLDFEASITDRQAIIDEMKASFVHLREALAAVDPAMAGHELEFFGRTSTVQGLWFMTAVHLHEHLGNSVTYARANHVVPPWSRGEGE